MKRPPFRSSMVLVAALAACSGGAKSETTTPGSGSDGPVRLAKRVSLAWGIQPTTSDGEAMADLYLALTDETGKVASHELGRWKGVCAVATPAKDMNALTAMRCVNGATGTELQVVTQGGDQIIVLKLGIDEGVTPDPMSREQVKSIAVPLGVAISVDTIQSTTGAPGVR